MDAIEYFKGMRKRLCEDHLKLLPKKSVGYQATLREMSFYDAAIKALEQEPDAIHNEREQAYMKGYEDASRKYRTEQSEDAISRQEVIDATTKYCVLYDLRELLADIETLPSVSTEKTGEWLKTEVMQSGYKETWIKCNKCGYDTALLIPKKYCPNCGSQMEGVEE